MRNRLLWMLLCLAAPASNAEVLVHSISYQGNDRQTALAPGNYRNPILPGFYPDPSIVRAGDDFYLVNSTFGYFPGLPIHHSRDLVNWTQIGNAIDRPSQINYGKDELTRGLFAASISHKDGRFYIVNTCFYCDGGNFLIHADNPAGPWSDPIWLQVRGIDPSLFFDADGSSWVVHNDVPDGELRYDGHRAIWLQQIDLASGKAIGERRLLVDGGADPASKPEHIEGPHIFKRDGWYYLTAAEGGTGEQHAQMIWRSRSLTGPYHAGPNNPVLTQRDLDPKRASPVTSAGHAQFVQLADGSWWTVFLATRPYRGNQYNLGRETFLLPVQWHQGWPQVLPRGATLPLQLPRPQLADASAPVTDSAVSSWTESFSADKLSPQWLTLHPPKSAWFSTGAGGLKLQAGTTPLGAEGAEEQAHYLGHRLQHHRATLDMQLSAASVEDGELAGLALLQNERYHYVLGIEASNGARRVVLYLRAGKDSPETGRLLAQKDLAGAGDSTGLRFTLDGARAQAWFSAQPGQWQRIGDALDASLLSTDTAGGFIGATFGAYALKR
ncbi:glycoside hydrolase family 43 protein [Stenotrophomonas pigmentata]|uniref:glycoside hydrolase family 43 protein n=1 Tax=Stenotrophomonas pigmentata TaxID=3055080 RepID=UPI0026E9F472|nr:glycoside hydrolase family 43 protein [Stenotrophomonas sp. 610A2]